MCPNEIFTFRKICTSWVNFILDFILDFNLAFIVVFNEILAFITVYNEILAFITVFNEILAFITVFNEILAFITVFLLGTCCLYSFNNLLWSEARAVLFVHCLGEDTELVIYSEATFFLSIDAVLEVRVVIRIYWTIADPHIVFSALNTVHAKPVIVMEERSELGIGDADVLFTKAPAWVPVWIEV